MKKLLGYTVTFFIFTNQLLLLNAFANQKEKIIFKKANEDNNFYIMNLDGTEQKKFDLNENIELNETDEFTFSSDGKKVAFLSDQIYIINIDGSNLKKITNEPKDSSICSIALSYDNSKIAFMKRNKESFYQLYTINTDGSNLTQLTTFINSTICFKQKNISWSSDNKKIIFSYAYELEDKLTFPMYIIDTKSKKLKKLIDEPYVVSSVSLSSNNKEVVFSATNNSEPSDVSSYSLNSKGTREIKLPTAEGSKIYKLNLENNKLIKLTNDSKIAYYHPNWSYNGDKIFFSSDIGYTAFMKSDGSNIKKILEKDRFINIVSYTENKSFSKKQLKKSSFPINNKQEELTLNYTVMIENDTKDVLYSFLILLGDLKPQREQLKLIKAIGELDITNELSKEQRELISSLAKNFKGSELLEKQNILTKYFETGKFEDTKSLEIKNNTLKKLKVYFEVMNNL